MKIIKYLLFVTSSILFISNVDAQSSGEVGNMQDMCTGGNFEIVGSTETKVSLQNDYVLRTDENNIVFPLKINEIEYNLYKGDEIVNSFTGTKFSQLFITTGDYKLEGTVTNTYGCKFSSSKTISVSKNFITYIGNSLDQYNINYEKVFKDHGVLFRKIDAPNKVVLQDDSSLNISANEFYLKNSDYIIINTSNFPYIFEILGNLSKNIDFTNKKFFLIVDSKDNFLTTSLTNYIRIIGKKRIFVVEKRDLLTFLNDFPLKEDVTAERYVNKFSVNFEEGSKYRIFAYFINNLIYRGVPTSLMGTLLILCVVFLTLNIAKQIIGLSTFGIFTPILFGLSVVIIGIKTSIFLLIIGSVSYLLTNLITKYIYLLYTAKIALLGTISIGILIVCLFSDKYFGLGIINFELLNNNLIIFPLMYTILKSKDVIDEDFNIFSLSFWFGVIEFFIIVLIVFFLLSWNTLSYFLLVYPEIIIVMFLLNILVGRFIGLQLLEYFRFIPLFKKHLEE